MSSMPALRGVKARGLLPFSPEMHSDERVDVAAISHPARTFTGDFYFTHRHDDRIWIAQGDVAGKGLPAAIVMAMIQEEIEHRIASCAETRCDPSATMQRLHEFLLPLIPRNRFATAVIAHLTDDGTLTVANGGHCSPLIVRRDGTIEEIASTGPVLGILPLASWRSFTTHLAVGESIVFYSDGVTESTVDENELGIDGLRAIVATLPDENAHALAHGIASAIREANDDLTVVVVRRT
jgi:phosphoserine phosphatase RsbU/P